MWLEGTNQLFNLMRLKLFRDKKYNWLHHHPLLLFLPFLHHLLFSPYSSTVYFSFSSVSLLIRFHTLFFSIFHLLSSSLWWLSISLLIMYFILSSIFHLLSFILLLYITLSSSLFLSHLPSLLPLNVFTLLSPPLPPSLFLSPSLSSKTLLVLHPVPPPLPPPEGELHDWAAGWRGRLLEITWFTFAALWDAILEESLEFVDLGR